MRGALGQFAAYLTGLGGFGILIVAALDSSVLFLPFSVDLLVIVVSSQSGLLALYYAAMATVGSVAGTLFIYVLARKGGEKGLKRFGNVKRLEAVRKKIDGKAGWALAIAAIMPPPYPYRPFVAAAGALSYSWKMVLAVTLFARFARFGGEAVLGTFYGPPIVDFIKNSDAFFITMLVLAAISILGTTFFLVTWLRGGTAA